MKIHSNSCQGFKVTGLFSYREILFPARQKIFSAVSEIQSVGWQESIFHIIYVKNIRGSVSEKKKVNKPSAFFNEFPRRTSLCPLMLKHRHSWDHVVP